MRPLFERIESYLWKRCAHFRKYIQSKKNSTRTRIECEWVSFRPFTATKGLLWHAGKDYRRTKMWSIAVTCFFTFWPLKFENRPRYTVLETSRKLTQALKNSQLFMMCSFNWKLSVNSQKLLSAIETFPSKSQWI